MANRTLTRLGAIVTLTLLATLGCKKAPEQDKSVSVVKPELIEISLGYRPTVAVDLALLRAVEDGVFLKEGIKINLRPFGRADLLFTALTSGEIQGSVGVPFEPILSMASNGNYPFRGYLVWYFDPNTEYDGFIVHSDSGVSSLADLAGKVVGTHPSKQVTYFLEKMLPDSTLRQYSPAAPLLPLQSGDFDAVYVLEPIISQAVSSGSYRLVEPMAISRYVFEGRRVPAALSILTQAWIESNPESAKQFVTVAREAYQQAENLPDSIWKIALLQDKRFGGFTEDVAVRVKEPASSLPEVLTPDELESFLTILERGGLLEGTIDSSRLFYIPSQAGGDQ